VSAYSAFLYDIPPDKSDPAEVISEHDCVMTDTYFSSRFVYGRRPPAQTE